MAEHSSFSDTELVEYFNNPAARRTGNGAGSGAGNRRVPGRFDDRKRLALRGLIAFGALTLAGALLVFATMLVLGQSTPSLEELINPDVNLATIVYTADGEVLTRFSLTEDRTTVAYDSISPHMVHALVATEDHRFYDHWGVDLFRTVSSVVQTILGDRQGGSTITQQLARNLYAEQVGGRAITPQRKLREMITAVQIERNYAKQEIIEMYLNTVPFGYRTYGIETAAQTYFGVPASQLNVEQSAMLVGMLKGTSFYNPVRHPERVRNRRNVVLGQMVAFGSLPPDVADSLRQLDLGLDFNPITHVDNLAPFFAEYVRQYVDAWAEENGYNTYTDGLVVHTTLDARMQALAQAAVDSQMTGLQAVVDVEQSSAGVGFFAYEVGPYIEKASAEGFEPFDLFWKREREVVNRLVQKTERYRQLVQGGLDRREAVLKLRGDKAFMDSLRIAETRLEVGFVAMDPNTREVKAWVGGRDYTVGKLDHVSGTRRQPGSTFKPFLYTAAIDNGYSPYYTLLDDTITIMLPGMPEPWTPGNSGQDYSRRLLTLRDGLRMSKNTIAARLVSELGAEQVKTYASRMGIESPLEAVPALALGVSDVSLLEMTNAYATLANGGFAGEPIVVSRIEDNDGNVLAEFFPDQTEVLSDHTTYTVLDMMRGTLERGGTGVRIRTQFGIDVDVAGKTGTTQNSADGWFMLMHPRLVVGSWVGFNEPAIRFKTNYWGQGAHNALFITGQFFSTLLDSDEIDFPESRFVAPEGWSVPLPLVAEDDDDDKLNRNRKGRVGW